MPALHLRGVSFAHTAATPLLSGVDLDLSTPPTGPSWIGVVGANGSGKTTLLRLLAGELAPTAGAVHVESDVPPVLVAQDVDRPDDPVAGFAADWGGPAARLRRRLALDPDDLDAATGCGWQALSPGQRKRWQVGAALASGADVLLLDEPTNHLDAAARDLLVDALRGHRGLGLVVSHDRTLLDALSDRTLRLADGAVHLHTGAYGDAAPRWRAEEQARRDDHDRARAEVRRQERILADVRRDRHGAEAGPRRERRLAGASRPDAREAGRRFAQDKAESALAARVRQMNTRVDRAAAARDAVEVRRDHRGPVAFDHAASGRRVLAAVRGDVRHAGGDVWLTDVDVTLARDDRVRLAGANGAGKTTLLGAVLAALEAAGEVVAVLPQEHGDDATSEVAAVTALDPAMRGRVLGIAARLGVDPERVLAAGRASPGETRKLALARAVAAPASVLVLDEPTNHLDLPAIEALEEALRDHPGAVLLVTHDDRLGASATTTWTVADRRVAST